MVIELVSPLCCCCCSSPPFISSSWPLLFLSDEVGPLRQCSSNGEKSSGDEVANREEEDDDSLEDEKQLEDVSGVNVGGGSEDVEQGGEVTIGRHRRSQHPWSITDRQW